MEVKFWLVPARIKSLSGDFENFLLLQNHRCSALNNQSKLCAVPPTPPTLLATGTTIDAVQLQWKQGDNGGAPIKGFLLAYRREFSEWEEVMIDRKANTHLLEGLQCGTRYQFTLAAFNRIGSGSASKIETAKTNGTKPIPPIKHQLIKANQTFVTLELNSWQDGGCPLLYFVVEYRRLPGDWLLCKSRSIFGFDSLE